MAEPGLILTARPAPPVRSSEPATRIHRVERIMGTAIGIDVAGAGVRPSVVDAAFELLRGIDARYSTYRPDSEVSQLIRGEIDESGCKPDVRAVLGLCEDLRRTSGGAFDIRRHRTDGRPDPTGLVKGWAIEEASLILGAGGATDYTINAGGDIVAVGQADPGQAWRVGIRHPWRADRVAAVLAVRDLAVATSGGYERGDHIIDPRTGHSPHDLLSMTVVGPSITYADAYATIGYVMGVDGLAWVDAHPGYGAYAITAARRAVWTPLIDSVLA